MSELKEITTPSFDESLKKLEDLRWFIVKSVVSSCCENGFSRELTMKTVMDCKQLNEIDKRIFNLYASRASKFEVKGGEHE